MRWKIPFLLLTLRNICGTTENLRFMSKRAPRVGVTNDEWKLHHIQKATYICIYAQGYSLRVWPHLDARSQLRV